MFGHFYGISAAEARERKTDFAACCDAITRCTDLAMFTVCISPESRNRASRTSPFNWLGDESFVIEQPKSVLGPGV